MKIRTANGFYMPSCFFMHIDSNESIESCITNNKQTFVHEYIHFLQDLIFPYSIRHTLTENRKFKFLNIYSQENRTLVRPFSMWDDDSKITDKQFSYTWGTSEFINNAEKVKDIESSCFHIYTGARIFKYEIEFQDGTKYQVGARDFLEYIAHKLESKRWNTSPPDFPYKSVDFLFDFLGYESVEDDIRMCIIEYCMFNDNPMHRFYQLLTEDFKKDQSPLSDYDSCKKLLLELSWISVGTGFDNIFTKSKRRLSALMDSLKDKYENRFENIDNWINLVINYSDLNFSNRFIFSELLRMNDQDFYKFINECISDIGIPLVFNKKAECISLLPDRFDKDEFLHLYVSFNFMNYVSSSQSHCGLYQYCQTNDRKLLNEKCVNNPIEKALEQKLCPMGQFVKKYGFHQVNWIDT